MRLEACHLRCSATLMMLRTISKTCRRLYSTSQQDIQRDLRALLRETAQPVAVVCSKSHGATLSSFTSISMAPTCMVAFSLRIPSRMAVALKENPAADMVINILSAAQDHTAVQFSRPDLHPTPLLSVPNTPNVDGLPIIDGSLGALACRMVAVHPLGGDVNDMENLTEKNITSELFIARVVRVEVPKPAAHGDEALQKLPLLYHLRSYCTTGPMSVYPPFR